MARILGLDVSTKTIGIALFEEDGRLLELTHITPKIKPQPETKLEELFIIPSTRNHIENKYTPLEIVWILFPKNRQWVVDYLQ